MGSWLIVAAFVASALYLIIRGRNFTPLPMLASIATAMLLCFFGFLFTAALNTLLVKISAPIEHPLGQSLLVISGMVLGLIGRHFWKQSSPVKKAPPRE